MEGVPGPMKVLVLGMVAICLFCAGFLYGDVRRENGKHWPHALMLPGTMHTVHAMPLLGLHAADPLMSTFVRAADLERLRQVLGEASSWRAAHSLTLDTVRTREKGLHSLEHLSSRVLDNTRLSLYQHKYSRMRLALELLDKTQLFLSKRLKLLQRLAAGRIVSPPMPGGSSPAGAAASGEELVVSVEERPFGMHLQRGSTRVDRVFPGFPAHRLGVRRGCEVTTIAGVNVGPGSWMRTFQRTQLPFELRLICKPQVDPKLGRGPLSEDPMRYRVMVVKRPFGMNIQKNKVPRVVEVLPGYPAEGAGVQRGFVLTEVDNKPVNGDNWFERFQKTPLPFTLTFNTTVQVRRDNPFFGADLAANIHGDLKKLAPKSSSGRISSNVLKALKALNKSQAVLGRVSAPSLSNSSSKTLAKQVQDSFRAMAEAARLARRKALPPGAEKNFENVTCEIDKTPIGMEVKASSGDRPRVVSVVKGSPAERGGVKVGDLLTEVAGIPVDAFTWFASIQQASAPFGLRFRRPRERLPPEPESAIGASAALVFPPLRLLL